MADACQVSRTGGPASRARVPSSQSATRCATPPEITPPSAQASSATAGPPRPRIPARGSGRRRYRSRATAARATTISPWASIRAPKAGVAGQPAGGPPAGPGPAGVEQAEQQQGERGERQRADEVPVEPLVEPVLAAAPAADHGHHRRPAAEQGRGAAASRAGPVPGGRRGRWSKRAAGMVTAAATVSRPAAVCAARSRATRRRPYQKPGRTSALPCASRSGSWASGSGPRASRSGIAVALHAVGAWLRAVDVGLRGQRLVGLVRAPRAVGEVPEEAGQRDRQDRGQGEPASGGAPPAAGPGRSAGGPRAPGTTARRVAADAGAGAGALPGDQVEGHLAGRGHQQHGQGEGRPGAPGGRRAVRCAAGPVRRGASSGRG